MQIMFTFVGVFQHSLVTVDTLPPQEIECYLVGSEYYLKSLLRTQFFHLLGIPFEGLPVVADPLSKEMKVEIKRDHSAVKDTVTFKCFPLQEVGRNTREYRNALAAALESPSASRLALFLYDQDGMQADDISGFMRTYRGKAGFDELVKVPCHFVCIYPNFGMMEQLMHSTEFSLARLTSNEYGIPCHGYLPEPEGDSRVSEDALCRLPVLLTRLVRGCLQTIIAQQQQQAAAGQEQDSSKCLVM